MTDDPTLAELLTLWPHLTDEARQSLLRIARAKVAPGAGGRLERPVPKMKGAVIMDDRLQGILRTTHFNRWSTT